MEWFLCIDETYVVRANTSIIIFMSDDLRSISHWSYLSACQICSDMKSCNNGKVLVDQAMSSSYDPVFVDNWSGAEVDPKYCKDTMKGASSGWASMPSMISPEEKVAFSGIFKEKTEEARAKITTSTFMVHWWFLNSMWSLNTTLCWLFLIRFKSIFGKYFRVVVWFWIE